MKNVCLKYVIMVYSYILWMFTGLVVREEYLFKSDSGKVRPYVSCNAALLLLFTTSSALQGEDTTATRKAGEEGKRGKISHLRVFVFFSHFL